MLSVLCIFFYNFCFARNLGKIRFEIYVSYTTRISEICQADFPKKAVDFSPRHVCFLAIFYTSLSNMFEEQKANVSLATRVGPHVRNSCVC